ncbi:MAG: DNA ligase D [Polyangiaceae bacterium]|nr:DNA ligase D [Polyangiaceae bacterium]
MPLDDYWKKRAAAQTPEPFGSAENAPSAGARGRFVVQRHSATRLHHDLRLEHGGVLVSWAVPKTPSLDPDEKRLAVKVEDHPLDYVDFEGVIPDANYGAGPVIVWDKGAYVALEDFAAGLESGKLLFELIGYKLRGVFTLVRTKRRGQREAPAEWLLIKKPDRFAAKEGTRALAEESVLSGRTVDEVGRGESRARAAAEALERGGAAPGLVDAGRGDVMLAETAERPFDDAGFCFELKYDGYRLLCQKRGKRVTLHHRKGNDVTERYPEIARAVATWPFDAVLDGEVVVLDDDGRPSFARLQARAQLTQPADLARAAALHPVTYFAFDLLSVAGLDARPLALVDRKAALRAIVPRLGPVRFADHVDDEGAALFALVRERGMEGVMAKRKSAPYRAGRSPDWQKVKTARHGDFVVVGTTPPKGARAGFGALELAAFDGDELLYVGRVGSGFSDRDLDQIPALLEPTDDPPCVGPVPREPGRQWVRPAVVVEVRYQEWVGEGVLRFPVFVRLRPDKRPADCVREAAEPRPPPPPVAPPAVRPAVVVTNPTKVFWPDVGVEKAELVGYYRAISPWMLPYLRDRPVVLTRYPDGVTGKSFFQHDAPVFTPAWVRTARLFSESQTREVDYFVLEDEESLAYVANLGTIPVHMWASRVRSLQHADYCSIDLDPKGAPMRHMATLAQATRALCDEVGLTCVCKTSGQSGLHLLVPLGGVPTHDDARALAYLLARVLVARHPDLGTLQRVIEARGGRVYLDTLQNGHGKTLVAPYSARAVPGAPVSMPLRWDEVTEDLDPRAFHLRNAPARMRALESDPLAPLLGPAPDFAAVLARLGAALGV